MDLSAFQITWIVVGIVLIAGWLVVSFSNPGRRRTSIEWVSASALFIGLLSLFVYLALEAWRSDSTLALIAFGFLVVFFGGGTGVSLWHTFASFAAPKDSQSSATN